MKNRRGKRSPAKSAPEPLLTPEAERQGEYRTSRITGPDGKAETVVRNRASLRRGGGTVSLFLADPKADPVRKQAVVEYLRDLEAAEIAFSMRRASLIRVDGSPVRADRNEAVERLAAKDAALRALAIELRTVWKAIVIDGNTAEQVASVLGLNGKPGTAVVRSNFWLAADALARLITVRAAGRGQIL